ncbi:MAG: hypothetical protein VXZ34_08350, partial [Candidatus Thermoplasmatota archaeon]|nr:hypothetical protein [Candidatus Thermoplasmatota archaeon]
EKCVPVPPAYFPSDKIPHEKTIGVEFGEQVKRGNDWVWLYANGPEAGFRTSLTDHQRLLESALYD